MNDTIRYGNLGGMGGGGGGGSEGGWKAAL